MPIDNSTRFPKPLAADLRELSEGMAIVIDGDTAPKAIVSGQYLFIKNHSTLATGGYHATAAIASGADITSSNVTPDADGIVNGAFSSLSEQIAFLKSHSSANATPMTTYISDGTISCERTGNMLTFSGTFCFKSENIAANTTIFSLNAYRPGNDYSVQAMGLNNITKHVNLRLCSDATLRKAPSGNIENDADWYYLCVTVPFHT